MNSLSLTSSKSFLILGSSCLKLIPIASSLETIFDFPDWSETTIFLTFPTSSGFICSYVLGSFWTAETCSPPLCEKAAAPT